jgi:Peptidase family M23
MNIGFKHGLTFFSLVSAASWLALAAPIPKTGQSASPDLLFPVKCVIGQSCLIQKLVDHDVTNGRRDYRCGNLTTDGHDGVDVRLRTIDDLRAGYAVLASAPGKVLRTRDGEPDVSSRERVDLKGKDAGNGIVVDHGDGWETQYSHLQLGSVSVKPGQPIVAGQQLGLIGMSGNAEFPHLHFTVRHRGKVIDPFTGAGQGSPCNAKAPTAGLWLPSYGRELGYVSTAVVSLGLASTVPSKSVAERTNGQMLGGPQSPIILWADIIGAKPGDVQEFAISGPDGRSVHVQQVAITDGGLSWFAYSGKRAPAAGWPTGKYLGRYVIRRDGVIVATGDVLSKII